MLKKFLAVIFIVSVFFFAVPAKTFAASTTPANVVNELTDYCNTRNGNVVNLETWYSGKCFDPLKAIGSNDTPMTGQYRGFSDIVLLDLMTRIVEGASTFVVGNTTGLAPNSGVIASLSYLIGNIISKPPASSTDYLTMAVNNIQKHTNIVQPAYAAGPGVGFTALQPVLAVWQGLRNLAYAVYILIFVLYGFMIMFRVRLDPKVVTSFQMAIPKLIVTLLLITFSYAIAGLMIDLMYVISLGIGTALQSTGLINLKVELVGIELANPSAADFLTGNGWGFMGLGFITAMKLFLSSAVGDIAALLIGLPKEIASIVAFVSGISFVVKLVLLIALVYIMFKILFMFLQSYAKIILEIIFSPLILLGNVLPGNDAFGNWIRGLFAEMSIFPTTMIMMMIGGSFIVTGFAGLVTSTSPVDGGGLWVPPGLGGGGANTSDAVSALLGYSILLLTPKVADMVRDALKVPAFKYGAALAEPLKVGAFQFFSPQSGYNQNFANSAFNPAKYLGRAQNLVTGAVTGGKVTNVVGAIREKGNETVTQQNLGKKGFFG